jgi:hypothetical protein
MMPPKNQTTAAGNRTPISGVAWELRQIPLAAMKVDPSTQQRVAGTSRPVVEDYAAAMRDGDEFPPPIVFSADGLTYHLADGFHRIEAHRIAQPDAHKIACEVRPGDHDDALLFACGANASHGLPRSNSDKRGAVLALLNSEKWSHWSDREIARQCRVSHTLVSKLRNEHPETLPDEDGEHAAGGPAPAAETTPTNAPAIRPSRRRTAIRHGKSYTIETVKTGPARATSSSRPKNVEATPQLTSLAWSMATEVDRVKFVNAVGAREIVDAFKSITPGFSLLDWAWRAAGKAERQEFAKDHHKEIISFSNPPRPAGHLQNAPPDKQATPHVLQRGTLGALEGPGPTAAAERIGGPARRRRAARSGP